MLKRLAFVARLVLLTSASACTFSMAQVQNWPEELAVPSGTRVYVSFFDERGRDDESSIPSRVVRDASCAWLTDAHYACASSAALADVLVVFSAAGRVELETRTTSSAQPAGPWLWAQASTSQTKDIEIPFLRGEVFVQQPHKHPLLVSRGAIRLYYDGFADNREMTGAVGGFLDATFLGRNAGQDRVSGPNSLGYDPRGTLAGGLGCWPRYRFSALWRDGLLAVTDGQEGGVKAGDGILAIDGQPPEVALATPRRDGDAVGVTVQRDGKVMVVHEAMQEVCSKRD